MNSARSRPSRLVAALEWRLRLARAAIFWERLWPVLWPAVGIAGLFVALSLLDLWSYFPGWPHILGLGLFGAGLLYALGRARHSFRWPSRGDARRRLELSSGLGHRPLAGLEDRLSDEANADPATRAIWFLHRARMLAALQRLRVGMPRPQLLRQDPWGLRAALLLLLVLGFAVANDDAARRLVEAVRPDLSGRPPPAATLDAWINPPGYTGLPPIFLTREEGPISTAAAPIKVPTGSSLLVRVHGGRGAPVLKLDDASLPFKAMDKTNFQASETIEAGERLSIQQSGGVLADWRLQIVPDLAPEIDLAEPLTASERKALRIAYKAHDDYGLTKIGVEIRHAGSDQVLRLDLTLPGVNPRSAAEASFHDLTAHPWAGLEATLTLTAEDAIGQIGKSAPVTFTIPARDFHHPVARAIVEQRRILATAPERRSKVATAIGALALLTELYGDDSVVYLNLRSARSRLLNETDAAATDAVQNQLWDTALRVEDGNLSLAERELRDAQRALMDALARKAPDSEIERLTQDLRQALDRFLQAMAEKMEREAKERDDFGDIPPNAKMLSRDDLQRMLDRARELARSGARDAARDLLAQMQNMLENLQSGRMARMPGQRGMERSMKDLGDLMQRQQQLLDRTFRRAQRGQPGQQGQPGQPGQQGQPGQGQDGEDGQLAGDQESLRRQLGEILRRLGEGGAELPGALGRAERSMKDARDALGQGSPQGAVGPETEALDQLRQGAQSMMQQMMGQDGNGQPNQSTVGRAGNNREDPLGRPLPGEWDTGDSTKLPSQADLQRTREILEELYRRAGDRRRPELELDYIERLLRRF